MRLSKGTAPIPSKTNIAFVLWTLEHLNGSEKVVYDLVKNLDSRLYKVFIISIKDGPVRCKYAQLGAQVLVFPKRGRTDTKYIARIRRALLKENIHIVNAHHYMPLFWSFFATLGTDIKLVYTEHSRWQLEQLELPNKILNAVFLHKVDAVIAISKQIQEYYTSRLRLKPTKVHLIYNGVEVPHRAGDKDGSLKQELGLNANDKVIGIVASIKPIKNHEMMIHAFDRVRRLRDDVKLLLIGADYFNGRIHELVHEKGLDKKVIFLGYRDDVDRLLPLMDVFCLTSRYEGMPLSILEAMAHGVPVIGTDVLGINEVIENSKNGLLINDNDDLGLSKAIMQVLEDTPYHKKLSEAGRAFVSERFNIDDKINQYHLLFQGTRG